MLVIDQNLKKTFEMSQEGTRKRKAKDVDLDLNEVSVATDHVTIFGVMTELPPVKCSSRSSQLKYFTGKVSNGKKTMRVVSFNLVLRSCLHDSLKSFTTVALTDCQKKKDNYNGELEIIAPAKRTRRLEKMREYRKWKRETETEEQTEMRRSRSG